MADENENDLLNHMEQNDHHHNDHPQQLLLESFEHYLEQRGLPHNQNNNNNNNNDTQNLNFVEEQERIQSEKSYQQQIYDSIFQKEEEEQDGEKTQRKELLHSLQEETMDIDTSSVHGKINQIPLQLMAAKCDTIYCMVSSRPFFERNTHDNKDDSGTQQNDNEKDSQTKQPSSRITLSLDTYDTKSVQEFLHLVFEMKTAKALYHQGIVTSKDNNETTFKTKIRDVQGSSGNNNTTTTTTTSPTVVSSTTTTTTSTTNPNFNLLLECFQIAHYVQCHDVMEDIVTNVMLSSQDDFITTENCAYLVEFADQYELPRLFEKALNFTMCSLEQLETLDIWNDFTVELRTRIQDIMTAIHTSIHHNPYTNSNNNNTNNNITTKKQKIQQEQYHPQRPPKKLYFASIAEYLAIFAENVQYHRERLDDAKQEQQELQRQQQHGRQHQHHPLRPSRGYEYAAEKIAKQEQRVRTLEAVMKEQKKLFKSHKQR